MKISTMKDLAEGRTDLWKLDPREIEIEDGFNVRTDFGDIERLMKSIIENGTESLAPLLVRKDGDHIYLIDGHRRLKAILRAIEKGHEIKSVPCQLEANITSEERRTLNLIIRNDGKPLTPLEEARVISRLVNFGWTEKDVAVKTGRSQTHIRNLTLLGNAPTEVLKQVDSGKIAASLVIDLTREVNGDADQLKAKVSEAIQAAADSGKDHASRKHLPTPPDGEPEIRQIPEASNKTDWSQVSSAGMGGGGPGGEKTSYDTTKNTEKLNKMLEKLKPEDCKPELFAFTEALVDFLEGARPLADIKKMLLLS